MFSLYICFLLVLLMKNSDFCNNWKFFNDLWALLLYLFNGAQKKACTEDFSVAVQLLIKQLPLYLVLFFLLHRCCLCIPVTQSSAQWACSFNAGYSQAASGAWLPAPSSALAPPWRLDKGGWCSSYVAHEAACCSTGGGNPESRNNSGSYIPFPHDVCRTNWGKYIKSLK